MGTAPINAALAEFTLPVDPRESSKVLVAAWKLVVVNRWRILCASCFDTEAEKAGVKYTFAEVEAQSWSERPPPAIPTSANDEAGRYLAGRMALVEPCTDIGLSDRRDLPSKNAPCSIVSVLWNTSASTRPEDVNVTALPRIAPWALPRTSIVSATRLPVVRACSPMTMRWARMSPSTWPSI